MPDWITMNVCQRIMDLSHQIRRSLSVTALVVLASVSIGACGPNPTFEPPQFEARVSVLNKSHEMHVLRIRELRPEVGIDCGLVARAPAEHLSADAFGVPVRWPLFSGQEIGLGINARDQWQRGDDLGGRECSATLIQSDTTADIVVFWDRSLTAKSFEFDPDIPKRYKADPQTVVLRGNYEAVAASDMKPYRLRPCAEGLGCGNTAESVAAEVPAGARYFWESVSESRLHFVQPWRADERPQTPVAACQTPGSEAALAWETPLNGEWEVLGLREGVDGCHTIELQRQRGQAFERNYVMCAPFAALDALSARPATSIIATFADYTADQVGGLALGVRYESEQAGNGQDVDIYLLRGSGDYQIGSLTNFELEFEVRAQCTPVEAACGQAEMPVDARMDEGQSIGAGESASWDDGARQLHLVRAFRRSVVDSACTDDEIGDRLAGSPGNYVEAVAVIKN
jgi:hypothetical protein